MSGQFFSLGSTALVGLGLLYENPRSHSDKQTHARYDSSERVIGPSHRCLHDNTQHSLETHANSRRDSNPQSQQATDHLECGTTRIGSGHFAAGEGTPPPHFLVNRSLVGSQKWYGSFGENHCYIIHSVHY